MREAYTYKNKKTEFRVENLGDHLHVTATFSPGSKTPNSTVEFDWEDVSLFSLIQSDYDREAIPARAKLFRRTTEMRKMQKNLDI